MKLLEGLSPILYHGTGIRAALDILHDDMFKLTYAGGTASEREINNNKKYFLSTSRNKMSPYYNPDTYSNLVVLVLDGKKLQQDGYSGKPVDYWQYDDPTKNELEDRIMSNKPVIPGVAKYIKEMHILHTPSELASDQHKGIYNVDTIDRNTSLVRKLAILAKRKNIPVYLYTNATDMKTLNKKKAVPLSILDVRLKKPASRYYYRSANPFRRYVELLVKNDRNQLSSRARQLIYYPADIKPQLSSDLHNNKKANSAHYDKLVQFVKLMKKHGLESISDFEDFVVNKFKNQY